MDTLVDFSPTRLRHYENAEQAHAAVSTYADRHPSFYGVGTTLVMARLMPLPTPRSLY